MSPAGVLGSCFLSRFRKSAVQNYLRYARIRSKSHLATFWWQAGELERLEPRALCPLSVALSRGVRAKLLVPRGLFTVCSSSHAPH